MKLESLKSEKFKAFETKKISNAVTIVGGKTPVATCKGGCSDYYDYATQTPGKKDGNGTPWDFEMTNNDC